MDSRQSLLIIIIGAIACIVSAFIDIFLALGVAVVVGVVYMMLWIMQDAAYLPHVVCSLSEDAKSIIVRNIGTAPARKIHVALVPLDIEFDIREIQPDEEEIFTLEKMIQQAKVVVRYSPVESDSVIENSYPISSVDGGEYDPLKPMFPIFGWKK
jgi:hypothetical protein